MVNRLSKIVTRGGDGGETGLTDGARVSKADPRIALLGDIDELNSWIGVVLAHQPGEQVSDLLTSVQHDLFDLGGALSVPGAEALRAAHVNRLDEAASTLNDELPPLKEFILPGGSPLLAYLHVARTVCRRVERSAVGFLFGMSEGAHAIAYLNRLSDILFIAARVEATRCGIAEVLWRKELSLNSTA